MDLNPSGDHQRIELEARKESWAERSRDAALVISVLEEAGIDATDFGYFVNNPQYLRPSSFDVVRALPVLIDWFSRVDDPAVKGAIARYLGSFRGADGRIAEVLLKAFEEDPGGEGSEKWTIGDAINSVAGPGMLDDLLRVAADKRHGTARQMIIYGLGKGTKDPRVVPALVALLDDEDVAPHAMSALRRRLGSAQARAYIEPLLESPSASIRDQAKHELRSIDKAIRRKQE